ncbi:MAG: hypothetical protein ACJASB_001767 [Shewanella psychromarinicola]|jgi:hypothetical protein
MSTTLYQCNRYKVVDIFQYYDLGHTSKGIYQCRLVNSVLLAIIYRLAFGKEITGEDYVATFNARS